VDGFLVCINFIYDENATRYGLRRDLSTIFHSRHTSADFDKCDVETWLCERVKRHSKLLWMFKEKFEMPFCKK